MAFNFYLITLRKQHNRKAASRWVNAHRTVNLNDWNVTITPRRQAFSLLTNENERDRDAKFESDAHMSRTRTQMEKLENIFVLNSILNDSWNMVR